MRRVQIKWNVGFFVRGKPCRVPGEKPLKTESKTNKLNSHMTPSLGIEPGQHWWQASALSPLRQPCSLWWKELPLSTFIAIVTKLYTRTKCLDPLEVHTVALQKDLLFLSLLCLHFSMVSLFYIFNANKNKRFWRTLTHEVNNPLGFFALDTSCESKT